MAASLLAQCESCSRRFDPTEGGICSRCGRLLCGWHLHGFMRYPFRALVRKPVCTDCRAKENAGAKAATLLLIFVAACSDTPQSGVRAAAERRQPNETTPVTGADVSLTTSGGKKAAFRVPSESEITDTVVLASLRRGRALLRHTRDSLPRHVGNGLNCTNCHAQDGLRANGMPFVGVYARFPQFRSRSGKVDLIEDRVNDCFERSMNGRALAADSRDMRDIVTYFAYLSRGFPVGIEMEGQGIPRLDPLPGDTVRGREVFATSCARCHGADGHGTALAPPLWGPMSYNIGAGMARIRTAAAYIAELMPYDRPRTLTSQQAHDVATYINTRPRPDFARKELDWPHGGQPPDVAYETRHMRKTKAAR